MSVSASTVKALRDQTGAGMMDCKKALAESAGDLESAVDWLRKNGIAKAAKKAGRSASEGIIGAWSSDDGATVTLAEVNCETDFVAKTDDFQDFVSAVAKLAGSSNAADRDALMGSDFDGRSLLDAQTAITATIGENIQVGRFVNVAVDTATQKAAQYMHAGSKIGVTIVFNDPDNALTEDAGRDVAMHVAAMNPQYVRRSDVPEEVVAKEKAVLEGQMAEEKKPAEIVEKIVAGRINKFYSEICLEEQVFVKDAGGKETVGKFLSNVNANISIASATRLQVGEKSE